LETPLQLENGWEVEANHTTFHFFMEIAGRCKKSASPFKFNSSWLKEEDFISLVKEYWILVEQNAEEQVVVQFVANLKRLKKAIMEWAHWKRQKDEHILIDVKVALQSIYDSKGGGYAFPESKEELLALEKKRRQVLEEKENTWILKI
jgi:hypothetical protein